MALATQYALHAIEISPGALPAGETAAWLENWSYLLLVAPLCIYLVLLFPNGRLPSARWRVVAWAGGASSVVAGVSAAVLPGPLASSPGVENLYGLDGPWELVGGVGFLGLGTCVLAAAVSMVRRLRRARGEERQQLKWFAFAASGLAIVFFPVLIWPTRLSARAEDVVTLLFADPSIPTGIAVLRHRLYDIDLVINRTLVYTGLTVTLATTYLGGVLLLQLVLSGVAADNDLAIAGSTLAVTALFGPARRRIQTIVDRRFYRRKYDTARTLERFGAHLRDEVDLDALGSELRAVVGDTLQPAHVAVAAGAGGRPVRAIRARLISSPVQPATPTRSSPAAST